LISHQNRVVYFQACELFSSIGRFFFNQLVTDNLIKSYTIFELEPNNLSL